MRLLEYPGCQFDLESLQFSHPLFDSTMMIHKRWNLIYFYFWHFLFLAINTFGQKYYSILQLGYS